MRGFSLCSLACVTLLAACRPLAVFSKTGGPCLEHAPDCAFDVITSRPAREFQVIGVIDVEAFAVRNLPKDEASFRQAIAKEVCRAGGDAVIPGVNGDHRYVLATVVKWVDEGRTTPICPKPPPDAGGPDGGKAGAHDAGAPASSRAHDSGADAAAMDAGSDASAHAGRSARATRDSKGGAPC